MTLILKQVQFFSSFFSHCFLPLHFFWSGPSSRSANGKPFRPCTQISPLTQKNAPGASGFLRLFQTTIAGAKSHFWSFWILLVLLALSVGYFARLRKTVILFKSPSFSPTLPQNYHMQSQAYWNKGNRAPLSGKSFDSSTSSAHYFHHTFFPPL